MKYSVFKRFGDLGEQIYDHPLYNFNRNFSINFMSRYLFLLDHIKCKITTILIMLLLWRQQCTLFNLFCNAFWNSFARVIWLNCRRAGIFFYPLFYSRKNLKEYFLKKKKKLIANICDSIALTPNAIPTSRNIWPWCRCSRCRVSKKL